MNTVLVILACFGASADCHYFIASDPCAMVECLSMSQPAAAAWSGGHPEYTIKRLLCTDQRRVGELLGRNKV
jgi:hypothetical protein